MILTSLLWTRFLLLAAIAVAGALLAWAAISDRG
jgi:hypothetical protein